CPSLAREVREKPANVAPTPLPPLAGGGREGGAPHRKRSPKRREKPPVQLSGARRARRRAWRSDLPRGDGQARRCPTASRRSAYADSRASPAASLRAGSSRTGRTERPARRWASLAKRGARPRWAHSRWSKQRRLGRR